MPSDSSWKTPTESPRASISYVFASSSGIDCMSTSISRERLMIATASSITSRLRRPEEVHLEEADLLDRAHRVLRDDLVLALGPAAFAVLSGRAAVLGELQGNDLVERAVGDHDRGGVDRVVADHSLEALRDVDDPLRVRARVHLAAQVRVGLQALLEAGAAAHDRLRDELCEPVAGAVVVAQHPGGVPRCGARRHLAEGDDLRDRLAAVLLLDVAHHPLAATDREVDVDVRHGLSGRVEEALEEEVVRERVEVRDVEAVGDDRAGRRAAARADRDPVVFAYATKSQTIRKYDSKPMSEMTPSSNSIRSTASAGSGSP